MGDIGDDITTSVPSVGAVGTQYATDINAILTEVIARLEARVNMSSLLPADAGLDMNGNTLTNVDSLSLYPQSSAPSGAPFGRFAYYNGEVYAVTPAGVVQLTSSGAVNTASTGSITGDFGTGPERVTFVNADERYDFWDDQGAGGYAIVRSRQFDYIDEATARVLSLKAPSTISAGYTLNLPIANPASSKVLFTTSAGQMTYADSANSVTSFAIGAIDLYHSVRTQRHLGRGYGPIKTVTGSSPTENDYGVMAHGSGSSSWRVQLPVPPVGKRITSVSCFYNSTGAVSNTISWRIYDGSLSLIKASASSSASGTQTITATANYTVATNDACVVVEFAAGATAISLLAWAVNYDFV